MVKYLIVQENSLLTLTESDNIHGNNGNDYLRGDAGNDGLFGGEGDDILGNASIELGR